MPSTRTLAATALLTLPLLACADPFPEFGEADPIGDCVDRCDGATDPPPEPRDARLADAEGTGESELDAAPRPDSGPPPLPDASWGVVDAEPPDDPPRVDMALDMAGEVDMELLPEEICDGADQDGDGVVDEGPSCGAYIQSSCRVGISWTAAAIPPEGRIEGYDFCMNTGDFDAANEMKCHHTRRDGRFRRLQPPSPMAENDFIAARFHCIDDARPDLERYIETHCSLFLGQALDDPGPGPTFATCPEQSGAIGDQWCLSTAGGIVFQEAVAPVFAAGTTAALGFRCVDPEQPERAAALTGAVAIFLGWSDTCPADGSERWGTCPEAPADDAGGTRCMSTRGDGVFQTMRVTRTLGPEGCLGFALRARAP